MKIIQYTAPTIEPITLSQLKEHLRLSSDTLVGNTALYQSLASGSHAIQNNYTVHIGTAIDVLGKQAVVYLQPNNNGATGTVDTKIQESDDNITWNDWVGGAFTQVTEANDTTIQEKAYTGIKQYIRTASKVLLAACEFGTSILVNSGSVSEDDFLTSIIQAGREYIEDVTGRALLTQTWDYSLDCWPDKDYITLPFGNLATVTSVKYKDTDGTETTLTVTTDYIVETNGEGCGRIVLPYGVSWPTESLYPSNPITIRYICGWTTAALIPFKIKAALKLICTDLYENRDAKDTQLHGNVTENKTVMNLLRSMILHEEF